MSGQHQHTIRTDAQGRNICLVCNEIVINAITDQSDPRLHGSGEVQHTDVWGPEGYEFAPKAVPLPIILVTLYHDGPEYGYARAPLAPYVEQVALREESIAGAVDENFWDRLSEYRP